MDQIRSSSPELLEIPSMDGAEPGAEDRDGESEVASMGPVSVQRSEPTGPLSLKPNVAFRGVMESPPSVPDSSVPFVAGNECAPSQNAARAASGPSLLPAAQPEAKDNPAQVLGFFARKLNQQANQHEHQESSAVPLPTHSGLHFPHPSWRDVKGAAQRLASHGHSQRQAIVESAPVAVNFDSAQPDWTQVRLD